MTTWIIAQLEKTEATGGVITAHWRASKSVTVGEGDDAVTYSGSSYGTCGFTPDASAEGFIAFEDLTESGVLAWCYDGQIDKAATEEAIDAQIEAQQNPVTSTGVPWSE